MNKEAVPRVTPNRSTPKLLARLCRGSTGPADTAHCPGVIAVGAGDVAGLVGEETGGAELVVEKVGGAVGGDGFDGEAVGP